MLGILLIYFIGKSFYDQAEKSKKNVWFYSIFGIVMYYVGTILGGVLLMFIGELTQAFDLESASDILIDFICMPFGLLTIWGLHLFLKKRWSKTPTINDSDILDANLISE